MNQLRRDRKIELRLDDQDLRDAVYFLGFYSKRKRKRPEREGEKGERSR